MKNKIAIFTIAALLLFTGVATAATQYQAREKTNQEQPLPYGNYSRQRFMNQIRDTLGICKGGYNLTTLTGIMTYDEVNFYIENVELHTSAMSAVDYDQDGEIELVIDELLGLVGNEVTVEGHYQSDDWMSVFTINGEIYREPGSPIWAAQHEWRWRYGHKNNQP